jgi:hypothetical protein
VVDGGGSVPVPPEALAEYWLAGDEAGILTSGSKRSGGFSLTTAELLAGSPVGGVLEEHPGLAEPDRVDYGPVTFLGRAYCRVQMQRGRITLGGKALAAFGVRPGDRLLVVRGSRLGIGFAHSGPLVDHAAGHDEVDIFV